MKPILLSFALILLPLLTSGCGSYSDDLLSKSTTHDQLKATLEKHFLLVKTEGHVYYTPNIYYDLFTNKQFNKFLAKQRNAYEGNDNLSAISANHSNTTYPDTYFQAFFKNDRLIFAKYYIKNEKVVEKILKPLGPPVEVDEPNQSTRFQIKLFKAGSSWVRCEFMPYYKKVYVYIYF